MSDGLREFQALAIAAADLATGALLARHVSIALGLVLAVFGVLVLCTVAYRTARRGDRTGSEHRQPA